MRCCRGWSCLLLLKVVGRGLITCRGAIEEGCTATSVRECSVELTCELVDNDEWFIEVINQQGEPVEFNVTTISRSTMRRCRHHSSRSDLKQRWSRSLSR